MVHYGNITMVSLTFMSLRGVRAEELREGPYWRFRLKV